MAETRAGNQQFLALISCEGHGFKRAYAALPSILEEASQCGHRSVWILALSRSD
jgi:hypothetical protein